MIYWSVCLVALSVPLAIHRGCRSVTDPEIQKVNIYVNTDGDYCLQAIMLFFCLPVTEGSK